MPNSDFVFSYSICLGVQLSFEYHFVPEAIGVAHPLPLQELEERLIFRRGEKRYIVFRLRDERGQGADIGRRLILFDIYKGGVHIKRFAGWQFVRERGRLLLFVDFGEIEKGKYQCSLRIAKSWTEGEIYEKYILLEVQPSLFERRTGNALVVDYCISNLVVGGLVFEYEI